MTDPAATQALRQIVQLILRGQRLQTLVSTEGDWRAIGEAAERMLFWSGGSIFGCRCEGAEIRFVVELGYAPIGAMAHHITAAYAARMRQRRQWKGRVFKRFLIAPLVDKIYLDDLIIWLHRPSKNLLWTADAAYLTPPALPWIDTTPMLEALRASGASSALYRRRKADPISPQIIAAMSRRPSKSKHVTAEEQARAQQVQAQRPSLDTIVRFVARYCRVSIADMHSSSRKREISKAKLIATVLSTRNGGSVADAAHLFGRSRSTLIERADHYRRVQPEIFTDAQAALDAYLHE
jgi:Bacterial dnaA protein helix-turn-helix